MKTMSIQKDTDSPDWMVSYHFGCVDKISKDKVKVYFKRFQCPKFRYKEEDLLTWINQCINEI